MRLCCTFQKLFDYLIKVIEQVQKLKKNQSFLKIKFVILFWEAFKKKSLTYVTGGGD